MASPVSSHIDFSTFCLMIAANCENMGGRNRPISTASSFLEANAPLRREPKFSYSPASNDPNIRRRGRQGNLNLQDIAAVSVCLYAKQVIDIVEHENHRFALVFYLKNTDASVAQISDFPIFFD